MVSSIPVMDRSFKLDAMFSYNCGNGQKHVICKNHEFELKPGKVIDGFIVSQPSLTLTSTPDICTPLDTLQLFGFYY